MIIKGHKVQLRWAGTEDWERFPASFVIAHDPSGRHMRSCSFYVAQVVPSSTSIDDFPEKTLDAARDYYGTSALGVVGLVVPKGKYRAIGRIEEIRYRREGSNKDIVGTPYKGNFYHPYEVPVSLRICEGQARVLDTIAPATIVHAARGRAPSSARAWRMVLPSGCRVTRHGFEWP